MNFLLLNFWLVCLVFLLVNVALSHRRAGKLVIAGRLTEDERQRFARGAVFYLSVFGALFQSILWASGELTFLPELMATRFDGNVGYLVGYRFGVAHAPSMGME